MALCVALVAACSRGGPAVDVTRDEPRTVFAVAETALEEGRTREAAQLFADLERLYPQTEWGKRGLIMSAFAFHKSREFEASRAAAQRYLDFFPGEDDTAYAHYLLALSYYDQISKVGRDQGNTYMALRTLRDVVAFYPDSEYARSAFMKLELALDQLAAKEMEVGRYYLKRKHFAAAINRFRVVVEDYQTTTQTPEALHRLVEAYLSLGLDAEAQTAAAILGYNFQASVWYQDSFALLTGRGLRPEATATGWLATVWRQVVRGEWL